MLIMVIVGGIALAANFIIVMHKFRKEKYEDAALDLGAAIIMTTIFGVGLIGTAIAMVGSAIFSAYLWFFPPKPISKSNTKKRKNQKSDG